MGSVLSVRIHLSRGGLLSLFFSSAIFYSFKFQYILLYHKILFCAVLIYISINFDQVTKSFEIPWSKLTLVITGLEGILTKLPNYHIGGVVVPPHFSKFQIFFKNFPALPLGKIASNFKTMREFHSLKLP